MESDPTAEWQYCGGEHGGLLPDEGPSFAGGLDCSLLDRGDGGVEFFHGRKPTTKELAHTKATSRICATSSRVSDRLGCPGTQA